MIAPEIPGGNRGLVINIIASLVILKRIIVAQFKQLKFEAVKFLITDVSLLIMKYLQSNETCMYKVS